MSTDETTARDLSDPVLSVKRSEWEALSPEAQEKLLAITGAGSRNLARAQAAADMLDKPLCKQPPEGWTCSRGEGHEGPCASSLVTPSSLSPFGYVTKDARGGWHFSESMPYLDNALDCFAVFNEAQVIALVAPAAAVPPAVTAPEYWVDAEDAKRIGRVVDAQNYVLKA